MLTTSHGIIGYFLFKNKGKDIWIYSVVGASLPDIPMITSIIYFYFLKLFTGSSIISHNVLHDQFIDRLLSPMLHSVFLWIGILITTFFIRSKIIKYKIFALGVGGLSHIIIDFFTHQGKWTWNHLYPLDFRPVEGVVYYLNPYFLVVVNTIWLLIFLPKIYKFFKIKYNKGD